MVSPAFSFWAPACAGAPFRARNAREGGFTLIEIMVALAVFSLAALALIRLEGATIRSTEFVDDALVAGIVARNVAIAAVTDARAPALGTSRGAELEAGRRWAWTRDVAPTGNAQVLRIGVTVAAPSGRVLGRITLVRPPDRQPA